MFAVFSNGNTSAFTVETLTSFGEILLVEFASYIVKAEFVGCDSAALTPLHRSNA